MSSDAGPVSFALLLLLEWRSEARARRPSQRPQDPPAYLVLGRRRPRRRAPTREAAAVAAAPAPPTPPGGGGGGGGAGGGGCAGGPRPAPRRAHPPEDAGCNLDPGREGPRSRAPPGYLLFFICFLLPGRRRKAQRKGKGRTEATRAAAPVPSGCAGARREARYFSLQIGSLQGLAATRKCTLAQRAAKGAGQGRHSPAQPHATLEALGRRGGPEAGAVTPPAFAFLPPPPLPRGARHVGRRELRRASPRSPGWPRLGRAPTTPAQPTCPLLGPEAPTSSWALRRPPVRSQAREVRRGLATGGTCVPRSQIRETVPAASARGDRSVYWNLYRCVRYEKPNVFTHLKILYYCCLDVAGAVLKALPWVGSPASLRPWGPEGRFARCPFTSPQVSRCSAVGIWTPTRMGHCGRESLDNIWAGFLGHDPRHPSAIPGREPAPCAQGLPRL
ncbi:uncharacterized protein LOC113456528 [Microtus ochrogaster]|uniref:Uncharacterized protein LOC113456528 n=1 Tax=Microtus ochrogaster TaxID=79684 RepID=A0ABM1U554_MICOH|nr:uncharacterized protein LOC113456528 [Microtus ochrogaster]